MLRFATKTFVMISLAALIGGCSSTGALFARSGYTITNFGSTTDALLKTALDTRTKYQEKADELEDANWLLDAPLFASAVALVTAIYYGAHQDTIAGITIGAGTIAAGRTLLKPTSRATGYFAGAKAMRCIYSKGQPFNSKTAGAELTPSGANGGNLSYLVKILGGGPPLPTPRTVGAVETMRPRPTIPITAANAAVYDAARKAYETALAAGRNALTTARKQLAAANSGVPILTVALMSVEDKVKTLLRLEPLDFGNIMSAVTASLTASATQRANILKLKKDLAGVPPASAVGNVAGAISNDITEINGLKQQTAQITGLANSVSNYPIDYLQAKTDVAACATLLGSK